MLDPAAVTPTPWRNGTGTTRELAAGADESGDLWRVSVADLNEDAQFSYFPGMDRLFVALGPLRLEVDQVEAKLTVGDQIRFPGEATVSVTLEAPTRALNVMTNRGRCQADVVLRTIDDMPVWVPSTSIRLDNLVADLFLRCTEGAQ